MSKIYVGIDIGKNGGVVSIHPDGEVVTQRVPLIKDEIDTKALGDIIEAYLDFGKPNLIFGLEDVHSIYGVSAKANFQFGRAAGLIEGYITAFKLSHQYVQPKTWQAVSFLGVPKLFKPLEAGKKNAQADTKAMALIAAQRLYPMADLIANIRARKPHDGIIDSLLIAHYLKQTIK